MGKCHSDLHQQISENLTTDALLQQRKQCISNAHDFMLHRMSKLRWEPPMEKQVQTRLLLKTSDKDFHARCMMSLPRLREETKLAPSIKFTQTTKENGKCFIHVSLPSVEDLMQANSKANGKANGEAYVETKGKTNGKANGEATDEDSLQKKPTENADTSLATGTSATTIADSATSTPRSPPPLPDRTTLGTIVGNCS